ncbi:D-mandelate dehydrogenase-like dehydrogenase [Aspergillus clavatus NRRL 1]|uniref:D-mandelate dehydrogenase, putative n=1 Tax=Aspergillus clavatus (strain ATCC 1007 / CBS 513.65 / DSM 816 / NCTC 3887 / NRRL 1 / QM 1276 / 107) TaxID=344612 RepID=A1CFW0_ASPCL|nr:D-mandelate dehydrogenase, putative [Aspergillus clavatus NRRL 1]EAW11759.1 D-mandelate dehydrogenase, putative [Aspergillus clavatus NRRL 1]
MAAKFRVLHLGDDIKYNHDVYQRFASEFDIIQPTAAERERGEFMRALKDGRWGNFHAIFRPFWNTGGEMGRWDAELIPLLPASVRIMASAGAGYDWADVDVFAQHGIVYCNGAAASSESVADMALFLILAVFRNLAWSHQAAHSLSPQRFLDAHQNSPLTALNPRGRTLGIIGLGQIGYTIAKKAHAAFGMKIAYNDLFRKSPELERAVDAQFVADLDDLLGQADCVIVATPFAGKTLVDAERLRRFKRGARFINIARGSLVDEEALLQALDNGQILAAGLDVHASEPYVHPRLATHSRVMMMSHNAGGTVDTHVGFERLAMENIEGFLLRGKALTPVNLHLTKPPKSVL